MEVSQVALCRSWPPGDRDRLDDLGRELRIAAGERLVVDEATDELYLVLEGEATVSQHHGSVSTRLTPGACFGDLHLLPGCDRAHDITAATPLRLLAFGPTELARLLGDSPAFARWLLRWLIERVPPPVGSASGDSDARSLELLSW